MSKYSKAEIQAVIDTLEKPSVEYSLSDGYYNYNQSPYYDRNIKRIAKMILAAIDKVRGK